MDRKYATGLGILAIGAVSLGAYACSSETTVPTATPAPSASATGTATNTAQPDSGAPPEARKSGDVRLTTYFSGAAQVSATFVTDAAPKIAGCTSTTSGACTFVDCDANASSKPASLVSAGAIEIYGGTPEVSIQVEPQQNVYVANKPAPAGKSFVAASRVSVRAAGAAVPAFEGTVDFPELVKMTAPTLGSAASVARDQDLAVSWTQGAANRFVAVSLSARTADRTLSLTCELPAEPGSGKIPAALLGKLPAGPAEIASITFARSMIEAGTFDVAARVGGESLTAAGDAEWTGRVTLK